MRMKLKKSLIFITFLLIYNIMFSMVEGPGGESGAWMYFRAFASVKDVNGQPLQGIQIRMVASYGLYEEDFETGFPEWRIYTFSKVGYTDANGNVLLEGFVNVTAYYPGNYKFYDLKVLMESPNYAIVSHSGDYSQLSNTSAYFTIGKDEDGNGVYDDWEYELAQKFCPVLKLHSGDHGVRPVPVEILDRNGDGMLNGEDVYYRIIDLALHDLGELPANNIWARS